MSAELSAAEVEALAEALTLAVMTHYGYTADDIAEAEAVHPGRICLEDECHDEDGETIHPPVYDDLHLTSTLMVDVVVPHVAALVAQAASERERALGERVGQVVNDVIADHPMWIGDDGKPLDYLPEREARIADFIDEVQRALRAALSPEAAS